MISCEYCCSKDLKDVKQLEKHLQSSKSCQNSHGSCYKCNFTSEEIQISKDHIKICDRTTQLPKDGSIHQRVQELENNKYFYEERCLQLQQIIKKKDVTITGLKQQLEMLRLKNAIYTDIISSQTNIKLRNVYDETTDDGVHIYDYEGGKIPVTFHEYIKDSKSVQNKSMSIKSPKKPRKKREKQQYRSIKSTTDVQPQETIDENIKKVDETFDNIESEYFDVSQKETVAIIDKLILSVENSRIYTKHLYKIRDTRSKLLGKLNLSEYIKLLEDHTARLTSIFTTKKYDCRKRRTTISKSLTPLDQRLVRFGKYYDTTLEPDEIQKLMLTLNVNTVYPKKYVVLDRASMYEQFHNYSVAIYPIFDIIKRIFINPYGFSNICYLNIPKSSVDDPYSFYSLEKVATDNRRLWKMEIRLDDICRDITIHLRQYCISLFRQIYFDIFNDNVYRNDYVSKTQITQQDCEQLLYNIVKVSRPMEFCTQFREMIVEHATIQHTELDKFNFTADDRVMRKYFANTKDTDEAMDETICHLFDGMSRNQARAIWGDKM